MIYPCPKPTRVPKKPKRMKRINAKRGGHAFPHNVDEPYREWVRAQPCAVLWVHLWKHEVGQCPVGEWGVIDAAHVKTRGSGGTDRNNLVPLCHYHHMEQHDRGIRMFQERYGVNLKKIAQILTAKYDAEKFPCP